jgi:hypothetical protein
VDVAGRAVDDEFYRRRAAVVAFFDEECPPCERAKQDLIRTPLGEPLLALVRNGGTGEADGSLARALAETGATVVRFDPDHELVGTFAIRGFPTFLRIRNGVIQAASHKLDDVRDGRDTKRMFWGVLGARRGAQAATGSPAD